MRAQSRRGFLCLALAACLGLLGAASFAPAAAAQGNLDQQMIDGFNGVRASVGRPWVGSDACVQAVARARATDMAARGYFSHVTPEGATFVDLLNTYGCRWRAAGEIIERNTYPRDQAFWVALRDLAASPPHYAIIVGDYAVAGAAVVYGPDGAQYTVGVFVQR